MRGDCSENDDHNGECGQNPVHDDESRTPPSRPDERSPTDPCEPFKRIELSTVCEIEANDVLVKNSDWKRRKWAHLQSRPPPRAAVIAAAPVVQKIHVNVRLPEGSGTHWICVPKLGTHYARWTATLVKIPPVDKRLNKSTRTEEPVTVHMEVNRRKRVLSLTAPNTWLWCLSNIETSHADIASYTKPSVRVPVVQERVHCPCLDYAEEDEKA